MLNPMYSLPRKARNALALVLIAMLLTALSLSAAPPAQQQELGDVIANPIAYEGQVVTVTGQVEATDIGEHLFVLATDNRLRLDEIMVLAPSEQMQNLEMNQTVTVTGTVQTFTAELPQSLGFEVDEQISDSLLGRFVLVAESVGDASSMQMAQDVVARIGERNITQSDFDQWFTDTITIIAARQGIPLNEQTLQLFESMRQRFLQQYVAEETLLAEAERQGITVSDEDVQSIVDDFRGQFEDDEAYEAALTQLGFSGEDELREFLRNNETLQRIGETISDEIDVTDEEVQQFYDENPELFETENGTVPFEQVQDAIRSQLEQQEFRQRVQQLQQNADIELFADNLTPYNNDISGTTDITVTGDITATGGITGTSEMTETSTITQ